MLRMLWFCSAVLFTTIALTHGARLAQNHEINETRHRLKRQFDFGSIFNPSGGDFELNPFARPQSRRPGPGEPLIFSNDRRQQTTSPTIITTITTASPQLQPQSDQQNNNNTEANIVFINNSPMIATIAPFTAVTTSSPRFLNCFGNCPTTSEYNPICASNQQQYQNPQKFDCARRCGAVLLSACLVELINGQWEAWPDGKRRNRGMLLALTGPYQPRSDSWHQWGSHNITSNFKPALLNNGSAHPYFQVPGVNSNGGINRRNSTSGGQNVAQTNLGWVSPASNGVGFRPSSNLLSNNSAQHQWNTNGNAYHNWNAHRPASSVVNGTNVQNPVVGSGGAHAAYAPLNDSRRGSNALSWNPGSTIFGFPGAASLEPIEGAANKPVPYQSQSGGSNSGNAPLAPLAGSQGGQRQAPSHYPGYSNPYANLFIVQ